MNVKSLPLFLLCAMSALSATAQKKYLTKITSPFSQYTYTFGAHDKVVEASSNDTYDLQYKYTFDAQNRIVREDDYQKQADGAYKLACYMTYTYDAAGNLLTRENYNADLYGGTDEFIQSGLITYTYDAAGRLTEDVTTVFLDVDFTLDLNKNEYVYDAAGRLVTKNYFENLDVWGMGDAEWEQTMKGEYAYDAAGRLTADSVYQSDDAGEWTIKSVKNDYTYDAQGNVTLHECYRAKNGEWRLSEYEEYAYDLSTPATDYVYPATPELTWPVMTGVVNVRTTELAHNLDADEAMRLYATYTYEYTDEPTPAAIAQLTTDGAPLQFHYAAGVITLQGVAASSPVQVYGQDGRLHFQFSNAGAPLHVADLPAGTYIVKCGKQAVKFVKP